MKTSRPRLRAASEAQASVWADVLVRFGLLHAAIATPSGQWLVQHHPDGPVHLLSGPSAVVALAARIQHQTRTQEPRTR
ncbi:hypothetical protein [Streptomyces sp. H27-D2]|uniref:hypothetical protein n=1 Tax=Streptomyces sp. H27-D2 TaxID=3046304 RepID=UPI002DBBA14D|nr:hypothetical protein [Streptomyces sp. H27-D2]MEC4019696.1 hypothetical protein [Streptomyces sp. H27-D2]